MIVKIPRQRLWGVGQAKQFNELTSYLTANFRLSKAQEAPSFSDVISYAADIPQDVNAQTGDPELDHLNGEKCLAVRVNGVTSLLTASAEMNAVAAKNKRVKDAAYHYILSWPEHERPEMDAIFQAAEHSLRALNLQDHQYVIAIHGNTDNIHCHIAVNRVHPITFKSQHLSFTQRALHKAARESEIEHGWSHDNGIYVVKINSKGEKQIVKNDELDLDDKQQRTSETNNSKSVWSDPESLIEWIRTDIAPRLKQRLAGFTSWSQLHSALFEHGILLQHTGGGLRLICTDPLTGEVLEVPASKALRILKLAELEARFGKFQKTTPAPQARAEEILDELPVLDDTPWSFGNAKNFTSFGTTSTRGPGFPGPGDSVQFVRGIDVVDSLDGIEMLLPSDAEMDLRGREEEGLDQDMRYRDGAAAGELTTTTADDVSSSELPYPANRIRKRDPAKRQIRKVERAAARVDLKERYQRYRTILRDSDVQHQLRKTELLAQHKHEREDLAERMMATKQNLRGSDSTGIERQTALALHAAEHLQAKLALRESQRAAITALSVTRQAPLTWREWLMEQAKLGDQSALSALRGIVYQAGRDAKKQNQPGEHQDSEVGDVDQATKAYLEIMAQLLEEEKKEAAIRSGRPAQVRPYQADPLLAITNGMTYTVTGNGNVVFYGDDERLLFTDRGNRITFDRKHVTDDDLRLALLHAREKFGPTLTLTGLDPVFTARMATMADDLGMTILNPELQDLIAQHRSKKSDAPTAAIATAPTPERMSEPVQKEQLPPMAPASLAELEAQILSRDALAKFTRVGGKSETRSFIGPVAAQSEKGFVQHLGRHEYAVHEHPFPKGRALAGPDQPVQIKYTAGKPIRVREQTRSRDGR